MMERNSEASMTSTSAGDQFCRGQCIIQSSEVWYMSMSWYRQATINRCGSEQSPFSLRWSIAYCTPLDTPNNVERRKIAMRSATLGGSWIWISPS